MTRETVGRPIVHVSEAFTGHTPSRSATFLEAKYLRSSVNFPVTPIPLDVSNILVS